MTPFLSLKPFKMPLHWAISRIFPVLLCFACAMARADATAEVEELIQNKQWAQAQQRIQLATKQNPASADSPQWRLMRSQIWAGQGQIAEAITNLQALIQEFPELPEPYNNLGVLLAAQGQFDAAASALTAAIQARPNYKLALQNLGDLYTAMAQQAYNQAKNLNQDKSLLPLPSPAAATTTSTNTRTLR